MPAWVLPTVRSTAWSPLAGVVVCLAATTALAATVEAWPAGLLGVVAAALAAATVAGLRDPAAALLSAVPTTIAVRRARRLALLVPASVVAWLTWVGVGHRWSPGLGWPVAGLAALTTIGLAVAVWAPPRIGLTAGVAVPLAWVIAAWAGGFDWDPHPEIVTVAAAAALWRGRNR